jgi:hypothetical protein
MTLRGDQCDGYNLYIEVSKSGWFVSNPVFKITPTGNANTQQNIPFPASEKGDYTFTIKAYFGPIAPSVTPDVKLTSTPLKVS